MATPTPARSVTSEITMPEEKQHKAATAAPKKADEAKPEARELKEKELEQIAGDQAETWDSTSAEDGNEGCSH